MKCIFNSAIVCPKYEAQKELGYEPNLQEIQDKECPQCPYGPQSSKTNRANLKPSRASHGNYIVYSPKLALTWCQHILEFR